MRRQRVLEQRRRERDARNRKTILIGLGCISGFLVAAGFTLAFWLHESARQEAEHQALLGRRAALRAELLVSEPLRPERAAALLRRIDETRAEWQSGPDADAILRQADGARAVLAAAEASAAFAGDLARLQREFEAAGGAADWRQWHDRLVGLQTRAPKGATELATQAEALRERVDHGWFEALLATGTAPGVPAADAARQLATAAGLLEERIASHRRNAAAEQRWLEVQRKFVPVFDKAQQAAFPAAAIAARPWQDLRPPEANWVTSSGTALTHSADRGSLSIACTGTARGVVMLRRDGWHACVLAFDLQLDRGTATVFARADREIGDRGAGGLHVTTSATDQPDAVTVPAGRAVRVELTAIGDKV
ncbi:MAG: hypothetical protein FJ265_18435, partial [Planctomycetes bacterium]|nr:hypothetical protein [Planctomycetota bacterium]